MLVACGRTQASGPRRTRAPPRPRTRRRTTPAPSRVRAIQRHRIQDGGTDTRCKTRATDPGWEGSGHGDQRESQGGERDGDRARNGSRGHGAGRRRRQGTGRGCDPLCRPITTRQRPELTPEMPHERCKDSDRYKVFNFVDVTRYTAIPAWRVFGTSRPGRIAAGTPSRRE